MRVQENVGTISFSYEVHDDQRGLTIYPNLPVDNNPAHKPDSSVPLDLSTRTHRLGNLAFRWVPSQQQLLVEDAATGAKRAITIPELPADLEFQAVKLRNALQLVLMAELAPEGGPLPRSGGPELAPDLHVRIGDKKVVVSLNPDLATPLELVPELTPAQRERTKR